MSIVTEDGTAKADAETLCSVAVYKTYHTANGNAAAAALADATIEANLRKATRYMMGRFRFTWKGWRSTTTQALDWPRAYVEMSDALVVYYIASNVVPTDVQYACAELAFDANSAELSPDYERAEKRIKLDVLEIEYEDNASVETVRTSVEMMLSPYLKPMYGSSMVELVRT